MKKIAVDSSGYDVRMLKSNIRLLCWILAWTGTMVLADKAELYAWYSSVLISVSAIAFNAVLGLGMIITYMRYLRELDDLQRKIQFDALALSVGVGMVGGFTLSLLEAAKFIAVAEASDVILLLALAYSAATVFGMLRYR